MNINGLDQLRKHVPDLNNPIGILSFFLLSIILFFLITALFTIMRHPAYTAAQCIAFGLALLNGSWLALACALIFPLGLWGWVRLVEENELIVRFGPAYVDYRKRVPAFWPRLCDLRGFFEFLIAGR